MNPGTSIDLNNKSYSKPYNKIDTKKYNQYINDVLINKKLTYENDIMPTFEEIYELSKKAFVNFLEKKGSKVYKCGRDYNIGNQIYFDLNHRLKTA